MTNTITGIVVAAVACTGLCAVNITSSQKQRFQIRSSRKCVRRWPSQLYWLSLQLPFGAVVVWSMAVWTLMYLVYALLVIIPFEIDNSTEHIKMDAYSGKDHSRNDTLAAAFFFAVQTLTTTGYGSIAPTSMYV